MKRLENNGVTLAFALVLAFTAAAGPAAEAAVVKTATNAAATGSEAGPYVVSSTDLGNLFGTATLSAGSAAFGSNPAKLIDGSKYGGQSLGNTGETFTAASPGATVDITLDTSVNSAGYDITSIIAVTGSASQQMRTGHKYDIYYSLVGSSDFTLLVQVLGTEPNNSDLHIRETLLAITEDDTGVLASGVDVLRWVIFDIENDGTAVVGAETMYREFDIFGAATAITGASAPTPAALPAGVALLAAAACRRTRRRRG